MMNTGPMTKVSLLLGTIICLGAFFIIDNNIPVQALHKEEQILEDYDDLAEFANAVRNGDEDLEEIPIQSMEAADIYDDADDNMKDCIDLAAKVGDSLTDREVIHCVDDVAYFETKYSSNSTVPANATFATSTDTSETDVDSTDTTSTSDTTDTTSTSDTTDTTSTSDTTDTTSTSDTTDTTSTSDTTDTTSTSDDVTGNSLISELVKTGKFTEDEAKEFVSQNMLSAADTTSTSDDTSSDTNTDDTSSDTNTDDTSSDTNTDDTSSD